MNFLFAGLYALTGLVFVAIGLLTKKFPPKKINWWYGYRTPRSMKNQDTWTEANRFASELSQKIGWVLITIGVAASIVFRKLYDANLILFFIFLMFSALLMFVLTEKHLAFLFDKEGKRISR